MFLSEKAFATNTTVKENGNANIFIVENELILPEKKIVLLNDMAEEEKNFVKSLGYKGGMIV